MKLCPQSHDLYFFDEKYIYPTPSSILQALIFFLMPPFSKFETECWCCCVYKIELLVINLGWSIIWSIFQYNLSQGTDCSYYSRDLVLPFLLWHIFLMKANGPIFHFLALDGKILNESDLSGIRRKVQNSHYVSFSFFNLLHSKIMVQIPINP